MPRRISEAQVYFRTLKVKMYLTRVVFIALSNAQTLVLDAMIVVCVTAHKVYSRKTERLITVATVTAVKILRYLLHFFYILPHVLDL